MEVVPARAGSNRASTMHPRPASSRLLCVFEYLLSLVGWMTNALAACNLWTTNCECLMIFDYGNELIKKIYLPGIILKHKNNCLEYFLFVLTIDLIKVNLISINCFSQTFIKTLLILILIFNYVH